MSVSSGRTSFGLSIVLCHMQRTTEVRDSGGAGCVLGAMGFTNDNARLKCTASSQNSERFDVPDDVGDFVALSDL